MSATATSAPRLTRALDGARILWRRFLASDDMRAAEGYVREFSPSGRRVRLSESPLSIDLGEWYETADLRVVEVLEERSVQRHAREAAAAKAKAEARRRKRNRIEGDEWKDADSGELDLGGAE